jgi:hypothetical protein
MDLNGDGLPDLFCAADGKALLNTGRSFRLQSTNGGFCTY